MKVGIIWYCMWIFFYWKPIKTLLFTFCVLLIQLNSMKLPFFLFSKCCLFPLRSPLPLQLNIPTLHLSHSLHNCLLCDVTSEKMQVPSFKGKNKIYKMSRKKGGSVWILAKKFKIGKTEVSKIIQKLKYCKFIWKIRQVNNVLFKKGVH